MILEISTQTSAVLNIYEYVIRILNSKTIILRYKVSILIDMKTQAFKFGSNLKILIQNIYRSHHGLFRIVYQKRLLSIYLELEPQQVNGSIATNIIGISTSGVFIGFNIRGSLRIYVINIMNQLDDNYNTLYLYVSRGMESPKPSLIYATGSNGQAASKKQTPYRGTSKMMKFTKTFVSIVPKKSCTNQWEM